KPTSELVYSTYNLKQLNTKTNRVYLINEKTKAVDAQTPVSDSEKDNDCEFLQTPDGTDCSYIIDMFSIQALYKGNFEIIFNLKQLNTKTNRVYLINEKTKAVDAQTPVSDSEKDNDCEFLQTPDGTDCSYIIDMFSIQALYKGNFEIIFYADNPYTNNEEDYLRLSVWSFRGKTKSVLNNYLRDMTTNYKTSFLLPHDYEIPTFNYPQYVLPPVPYNYKPYTKDIISPNAKLPINFNFTVQPQCKNTLNTVVNLFDDTEEYTGYYETEIDLRQIDPTIQSIDKFKSAFKTIEISNLDNFSINNNATKIADYDYSNTKLTAGFEICGTSLGTLSELIVKEDGEQQTTNANFPQNKIIKTEEISTEIKTFIISKADDLKEKKYHTQYKIKGKSQLLINFLMQISSINNIKSNKVQNVYLQTYYTNDMKLKIRFSKVIWPQFMGTYYPDYKKFGNDNNLTFSNNSDKLNFINKNNNPVKITIKPN
ncbi:hypothetical protein C6B38_02140, partial [Spiroplasma sp. ChiS]|uniref:hypothetical protein n=1 Tax=Spiroplasma sp. ChiS TaxID=2099885 RepID=UPI000D4BA007